MPTPKKLIEVAMPIKEISVESVRDKSIRHGHISTLHLWWARRPLPVSRAVVFASLVPDPLDEHCPEVFKEAVELVLGKTNNAGDPYKPYKKIPYTSVSSEMEDNLRNRLLMFIGKYSDIYCANDKAGIVTPAKDLLSNTSLIKWDNKNNEQILDKARKLIWVSHNAGSGNTSKELIDEFEFHKNAINNAEKDLYSITDRHLKTNEVLNKEKALNNAKESFLNKMPNVFDPFAGGGAIPLEASRLGCRSFANDINPVAHIIEKASLEYPQKYGKSLLISVEEFIKIYGEDELSNTSLKKIVTDGGLSAVKIQNRLSFDVAFFAKKLISSAEDDSGHLYPEGDNGEVPIAYYWARVATCSNPSCRAEIPMLKQFYLVNKPNRKIYLNPVINGKNIKFEVHSGVCNLNGWMSSKNLVCPICSNTTSVNEIKNQSKMGNLGHKVLAVIEEGDYCKNYRIPNNEELIIIESTDFNIEALYIPNEKMLSIPDLVSGRGWGISKWSQLFSNRQLYTMQAFVKKFHNLIETLNFIDKDYQNAIAVYLSVLVDRIAQQNTCFGLIKPNRETFASPFGRQAIPMIFDYPESNPFCNSSGSANNQLDWILRYIESESSNPFPSVCNKFSSGEKEQFPENYITAVVTDPPYYDAIAYADLSDFFYVWLKRTLRGVFPLIFSTPQTPKSEECTALKHHHNNNYDDAKSHFENKLLEIFKAIEHQTSDMVSIMFAHQSTEAWTTLCNSILGSNMNITGSWAIDTEMENRTIALAGAALGSSVTVACKPSSNYGVGYYKEIKKSIEENVENAVEELYKLGFRGADLLTACFGKAVSEFGKFKSVEKSDGSIVSVKDLLNLTKEIAFNALLRGFQSDDFTKFYIGWIQLFGFTESDFDDAAKFAKVGLSIDVSDLFYEHILIRNGSKQTLATFEQRLLANKNIGERNKNFIIDYVHRAMSLYKGSNRNSLLSYISHVASQPENIFWRVVTSLCEILPSGSDDHKQALGLLTNKESILRECKTIIAKQTEQKNIFE